MMVNLKKGLAMLLCAACTVAVFVGCEKDKEVSGDEKVTVSMAVRASGTNYSDMDEDALYQEWSDKFGIELDLTELPAETMGEKTRLMVAAGDIPDVMHAEFQIAEYLSYANQGLIGALPDDFEEKYPNIAWSLKCSGIEESLRKTADGKIYAMPRTLKTFSKESDTPAINVDSYGFLVRNDWAEKAGVKIDTIMEYDAFMDAVKKIKDSNVHGGKDIMGISISYQEAPNLFVVCANSYYRDFYKKDGKYVFGLTEPETLEGMKLYKKAYQDGLLHPNFYAHKSEDSLDRFFAGKAVCWYGNVGSENVYDARKKSFEEANPGLKATEALKLVWVKAPDGKIHGWEDGNHWTTWYLSPELDGEKRDRVLNMFDYAKSAEGVKRFRLGVEGIDYAVENGEYNLLTWEKKDDGSYQKNNDTKYKFATILSLISGESHADSPLISFSDDTRNAVKEFKEAKLREDTSLNMLDYDALYFNGEKVRNFRSNFDVNTLMVDLVVSKGDLETEWKEKLDSLKGILDPAIKEINAELIGE